MRDTGRRVLHEFSRIHPAVLGYQAQHIRRMLHVVTEGDLSVDALAQRAMHGYMTPMLRHIEKHMRNMLCESMKAGATTIGRRMSM